MFEHSLTQPVPPASRAVLVVALLMMTLGASAAPASPPSKLALTGGRIITVTGDDIPSGTVLVENGKITAIGVDIELPYDAVEVDCTGKVLFPGMIDPDNARGLDRGNEPRPVTSEVDVRDAIDPARLFFEDSLRSGITAVHIMPGNDLVIGGVSRVLRPIGRTPGDMTTRADVALKLSTSPKRGYDRMLQMQTLREQFRGLDHYLEMRAEARYEETVKEKGEVLDVGPAEARRLGKELVRDEDLDDAHRNLVRLRDGRLAAWIHAGAAMDVGSALAVAKQEGFLDQTVLVLGVDAVRAVKELKSAGRPVVLDAELVLRDRDPISGEMTETFVPRVMYDAGLLFAIRPHPDGSLAERYPNYQAARCVRHGIPRRTALKAITLNPAKMLGLGDEMGSLEVGKRANIVVFTGDPLDFGSWVDQVFIDGVLAYERSRDPRIQDLLPKDAPESEPLSEEAVEEAAEDPDAEDPDAGDPDAGDPDAEPAAEPAEDDAPETPGDSREG